jgi:hypothetical protein
VHDNHVESELPDRLMSFWQVTEDGFAKAPRTLCRALRDIERAAIETRVAALKAALLPYTEQEREAVEIAIGATIGGFRSMRQEGAAAIAIVDSIVELVAEFPPWAIAQGCQLIRSRKTGFLKPPMNPEFPPNDCRVYEVVEHVVTPYRRALALAHALLSAPVEPPPPSIEVEAKVSAGLERLASSIKPAGLVDVLDERARVIARQIDVRARAMRVEVELAAKRAARETQTIEAAIDA